MLWWSVEVIIIQLGESTSPINLSFYQPPNKYDLSAQFDPRMACGRPISIVSQFSSFTASSSATYQSTWHSTSSFWRQAWCWSLHQTFWGCISNEQWYWFSHHHYHLRDLDLRVSPIKRGQTKVGIRKHQVSENKFLNRGYPHDLRVIVTFISEIQIAKHR